MKNSVYFNNGDYKRVYLELVDEKLRVSTTGDIEATMYFDPAKATISFDKTDSTSYIEIEAGDDYFKSNVTTLYLEKEFEWDDLKNSLELLRMDMSVYQECVEQLTIDEEDRGTEVSPFFLYNYETEEESFIEDNYAKCIDILVGHGIGLVDYNDFQAFREAGIKIYGH